MTSTVTARKSQTKISLDPVATISVVEEEEGEELSEEVDVDQVKLCGGGGGGERYKNDKFDIQVY